MRTEAQVLLRRKFLLTKFVLEMTFASLLKKKMCLQIEELQFSIPVLLVLQPESGPELNSHPLSGREDFPEVSCEASQEEREAPPLPG